MPRFERAELLKKFRAMVARGEPIVGGGAGTGLSAKCEEACGIDLIVIYNSGRYRMAGRGSLEVEGGGGRGHRGLPSRPDHQWLDRCTDRAEARRLS